MSDKKGKLPPYAVGSDTSKQAAEHMMEVAETLRDRVEAAILMGGKRGRTTEEVEHFLKMKHQTASARVWDLKNMKKVFDSGVRRMNTSGTKAALIVHKKYMAEHPPCRKCEQRGELCECPVKLVVVK